MRIAFDMQFSHSGSSLRGIGRYTLHMIQTVIKLNPEHSYFYFYPELKFGIDYFKYHLQQFLVTNSIDIFHVTSPFEYQYNYGLKRDWFKNTKVAVTFYDVIPLVYPEIYLGKDLQYKGEYFQILNFVKEADLIFAISETTKKDAQTFLGINPDKMSVIYGAVGQQFSRDVAPQEIVEVKARYNITKPYVLFVGNHEFRKNIFRLLQALSYINKSLNHPYQLTIVSFLDETGIKIVEAEADRFGILDDIIITGYIPQQDLVALYHGAELFAFPSLYEGLGLPILEAMACGTPVLTSNTTSLLEISGDATYLVNPLDSVEIAKGMLYILSNPTIQEDYRKKGLRQIRQFNWENVASKVLQGYEKLK